jgi:fatty-acyl-CoA synthase
MAETPSNPSGRRVSSFGSESAHELPLRSTLLTGTSLIPRIERAADGSGAVTFMGSAATNRDTEPVAWAELHQDACAMAAAFQARGVAPGSHVSILGPTTRALVTAIEATWLCGAAAVMLPLPMRLASIEEFVRQTRNRILASDSVSVVIDPQLAEFLDPHPGDPPIVRLDDLARDARRHRSGRYVRPAIDPTALAILQFTSGSTSEPKGVMLPHHAVAANLDAIQQATRLTPGVDVGVSWLPLYHDMGLIGLLSLPMTTGIDLVLGSPQDFLAAPARWVEWMSEFGGTVTAGPNFSYVLAARSLARLHDLDLTPWRIALNGAEPVDPDCVDRFVAAGHGHGLDPGSVFPAFGMAEATLAVTFPDPGSGMATDAVDARVLEHEGYAAVASPGLAGTRRLARLGRPLHNLEIRIVDERSGAALGERAVGELEVRGDSVTPGYYRDERATSDAFHDGWLRTGDLGYLVDGELVVCGRIKDVIILGGRNVHPQDVERAVGGLHGVRAGNVIAFGAPGKRGRESLVVVAETKEAEHAQIRDAIRAAVYDSVGLPPADIVLVEPGTLPKTSSGKLQRSLCKQRYLASR